MSFEYDLCISFRFGFDVRAGHWDRRLLDGLHGFAAHLDRIKPFVLVGQFQWFVEPLRVEINCGSVSLVANRR